MYTSAPSHSETFEERLATFVLTAFAAGVDVEGVWHVAGSDPVVPGLRVTITRSNAGPTLPRTPDDPAFADALHDLLLGEFAAGTDIDGRWAIRFSRSELPAWDVEIEFVPLERTRATVDSDDA